MPESLEVIPIELPEPYDLVLIGYRFMADSRVAAKDISERTFHGMRQPSYIDRKASITNSGTAVVPSAFVQRVEGLYA